MIIKIDFEKVADRIEWDFIRSTLQFFKFHEYVIQLIMRYIFTSSIDIAFNGGNNLYSYLKGIGQGDPLYS